MTITQQELETRLWDAASALLGPVDPADFKTYVFPRLFWKWISDTWVYEHDEALDEYGDDLDDEVESEFHRFEMPDGTLSEAVERVDGSLAFLEEALSIAQDDVAADRAAGAGDEKALERLADPKRDVLTQIVEENTPPSLHQIVPELVNRIDAIVHEVAYTGWTTSDSGDKSGRRELRAVLKSYVLLSKGDLFDLLDQNVREDY